MLTTATGLHYLVGRARWLIPVAMVIATIGPWMVMWKIYQDAKHANWDAALGPYVRELAADEVAQSLVVPGRRPVVLAPPDLSMYLTGAGNLRVIGSFFWSNTDGLYDHYELYATADDDRFNELLQQHDVDVIVFNGVEGVRRDIMAAYFVLHNRALDPAEAERTSLARLLIAAMQGNQLPHVTTPRLQQLTSNSWTGNWRLVFLDPNALGAAPPGRPRAPVPVPVSPSPEPPSLPESP